MNTQNTHTDYFDFLYTLDGYGWSSCLIRVQSRLYFLGPTHIFDDPTEVLLESLIRLLRGENEISFKWYDEPGEYNWTLKKQKDRKHVIDMTVTNCSMLSFSEKHELTTLQASVKLKHLCICILHQVLKTQDLMAEKSYNKTRVDQFPYKTVKEFQKAFNTAYNKKS